MILITGASGFVGPYLKKELENAGFKEVIGSDLNGRSDVDMDVTNAQSVYEVLEKHKPDTIYHLAGFSSVRKSFDEPELCMKVNVEGTRNIFEAVKKLQLKTRILVVGSSDIYGPGDEIIRNEESPINPTSPYAQSRVKQEEIVKTYPEIDWIITRSFPHIGAGQQLGFVTADFASQIAQINTNKTLEPIIRVGNLDAIRDFTSVKDTVRAYRQLIEKGQTHEIYNVSSQKGYKISELLDILLNFSPRKIRKEVDPDKLRPSDIPVLIGENSKLVKATGWNPEVEIRDTLMEVYNYWLNFYSAAKK